MCTIDKGALVIAHCHNPREKLWGEVQRLDQVGVVIRGLDLTSVEDWLRQEKDGSDGFIAPSTLFIPMHRIERIYIDESNVTAACFSERYTAMCDGDVREALKRETAPYRPSEES